MRTAILVLMIILSANLFAKKKYIREGNELYEKENFSDAELQYRKAFQEDSASFKAKFNLADALYKQERYDEAAEKFLDLTASRDISDDNAAKVFHNLGNSYVKKQNFQEAIDAYKNALIKDPKDNETRYNLEYAKKMLQKQQQEQQKNKDEKNKDEKDKDKQDKKDQSEKDKDQQEKEDSQDKQNQNSDKKENEKDDEQQSQDQKSQKGEENDEKQQAQKGKKKDQISKEDAQRILNALMNQEKQLQRKLKKKQGENENLEKNW